MKNIFKFFGTILTLVLAASLSGCLAEDELQSADVGLHVKVFFPTKVVKGQPMTINGSGFSDVTEIVFPDGAEGIVVTDFQIVSNEMIRVDAPSGISAEGGKIILRTEAGEQVESPLPLTLGNTVVSGYSAEEGVEVEGGSQMTIYGTDLEFVNKIEMLDADGNPQFVEDKLFNRKGTDHIIFTVPRKVFEGEFQGKVYTIDGKTFLMPMLTYKPASDGGYWETVENIIWENDGSVGEGTWGNTYRFAGEGTYSAEALGGVIQTDLWEKIKTVPFKVLVKPVAEQWQIRVITGYWGAQWPKANVNDGEFDIKPETVLLSEYPDIIVDNGDGTYVMNLNFAGHEIATLIDEQNLLFAGQGFQILKIYTSEEVWVPGGSIEIVRTSIWKNDGSVGEGTWGNTYRFAGEGTYSAEALGGVIQTDLWEKIKTDPFKVLVKPVAEQWQIRVITGYWGAQWPKTHVNDGEFDIKPETVLLSEYPDIIVDNGDGTYVMNLNFAGHEIATLIDEQNLLFAGQGFQILEMYFEEEVFVPGGDETPTETVVWEGSEDLGAWSVNLEIKPNDMFVTNPISAGQTLRFYVTPTADWWQFQLFNGHWGGMILPESSAGNNNVNAGDTTISEEGYIAITVTDLMVEELTTMIDWGYAMVVQGENIILTKISFI